MSPRSELAAAEAGEGLLVALGKRVRDLRAARDLSLRQMADAAELSTGLISQIERGVGNPSYVTVTKIANSLGVPVNVLFGFEAPEESDPFLVRRDARKRLMPARGDAVFELVTPDLRRELEVLWIELEPGAAEPSPYEHDGEECVLVIQGEIEFNLGERLYALEQGDSLTFPGRLPHFVANVGESKATLVVAITPPSF